MHKEILNSNQKKLLDLITLYRDKFYLVGGTAIALQIGHRQSLDYDLFSENEINSDNIIRSLGNRKKYIQHTLINTIDEFSIIINNVKITFLFYPFKIPKFDKFENYIRIPSLLNLAAIKAYTIGRRTKWKDYVDLYFLLKDHFTINEISQRANSIYGNLFNSKLFREQLCYYNDIDYSESVKYINNSVERSEIKNYLSNIALQI